MANQLYAAPIIIEAFQTGKAALLADYEIQSLRGARRAQIMGHERLRGAYPVLLDKGISLIGRTSGRRIRGGNALGDRFMNVL
jgi:hypothetical protein